jgi:hypothetical protein
MPGEGSYFVAELYPGRSVIVCEMLAAWKDRNRYERRGCDVGFPPSRYRFRELADAQRQQLAALWRVWVVLRALA